MTYILHLAALLAVVKVSLCSVLGNNNNGNFELLILHNNDMHARFEQTSQMSGLCTTADRDAGKCYGGFPRVAHVVKEARAAAKAGTGPPVLYLNAGDTYTGTAWFTMYKWKIAAEFINALQPDAVSLGNNEFEIGSSELSPFLQEAQTTILASNVIIKSAEKVVRSVVLNMEGTMVGLVGYLTPDARILDSAGNIEYIDEILALKEEVANLKIHNVNIIIALGHSDVNKNKEIAREVEDIDLVIAGHKNTFYWNGTAVESETENRPIVVIQPSGKRVPVFQSFPYDKYLGKVHATFNANGDLTNFETLPILLDNSIQQDSEAIELVTKYTNENAMRYDEVIGETVVVLDGGSCNVAECNLGNLITDAIMYYYAIRFEGDVWSDAPIAIIPSSEIAASISVRPSPITLGNLLSILPKESQVVAVTMNGTVLLDILEHSVLHSKESPTGQFLQYSGIRVEYDLEREPGSRVVEAAARCWSCTIPTYYEIDTWRTYKVLMPVALADGLHGYSMLVDLQREALDYDEVTCVAEYIRQRSPVYPEVAERIMIPDAAVALSSTLLVICIAFIPMFV